MNRLSMLLAPEGAESAPAGGSDVQPGSSPGPTPSPAAAAPPPAPRVPFVNPDAPPSPRPGAASAGGPSTPQDNPIPYSRVQEMMSKALRDQEQRLRSEFERAPRGLNQDQRLNLIKEALRLGGVEVPAEQPSYLTQEQFETALEQRLAERDQHYAIRSEIDRGTRELEAAKLQYKPYFEQFPELEAQCQRLWGAERGMSMTEVVAAMVKRLDAFYESRTKAYHDQKQLDRGAASVRPHGATPAARPPQHDLATKEGQDAALDEILDGVEG